MNIPTVKLRNNVEMPRIVLGTFQHNNRDELRDLIKSALQIGYRAFDTAPSYRNEEVLGSIFEELIADGEVTRGDLFLIDKIDGWQMQQSNGNITEYVEAALSKLRVNYLDLLLIHWPFPEWLVKTWESCIAANKSGIVKSIGLCNVHERHLLSVVDNTEFTPDVVQVERHPLNSMSGLVALNEELGIITQAYSPVCRMIDKLSSSPIIAGIAEKHGRSKGQVIMRWHIDTGVVPVFMTTRSERLEEYKKIFDFHLDASDLSKISMLNENYKIFLESRGCPGF